MSDEQGRNPDGTFQAGSQGVFASPQTQREAGVNAYDTALGAQIKVAYRQQAQHGPGGVAAAGSALGAIASELNWKDPIQVLAFLAAAGLLFLWILVAGPLAPFFWALTLTFVLLPVCGYFVALRAAARLGSGVRVRFGFRGSFSLALSCLAVYTLLVDLLCWFTSRGFPAIGALLDVAVNGPEYSIYTHHRIEMGVAGVLALPLCVLLYSWFARRVANGKRATPWYLKIAGTIVLLPLFVLAFCVAMHQFYLHHRELTMRMLMAIYHFEKSLGLSWPFK
ncbi:membrane hypothetical protein [Paraburkholderia unamae]|uniref:hypothetical protein n=1 Tax=Paraburkholderia unamae TaxID=219649 RepID=UPI001CB348BB|nr:hypothetical protein [Paraburkholderia unamae]CAG9245376.1 membrane hypothetical protein [Paraburkholderia unamae]